MNRGGSRLRISTPKAFARHGRRGDQDGQAEQAGGASADSTHNLKSLFAMFLSEPYGFPSGLYALLAGSRAGGLLFMDTRAIRNAIGEIHRGLRRFFTRPFWCPNGEKK